MRIAIGSDHAGFEMKENLAALLRQLGHQVIGVGTHSTDPNSAPLSDRLIESARIPSPICEARAPNAMRTQIDRRRCSTR